jgi:hypothetical protein
MDRAGLTHSWNGRLIRGNVAVRGRLQWPRVGSHGDASGSMDDLLRESGWCHPLEDAAPRGREAGGEESAISRQAAPLIQGYVHLGTYRLPLFFDEQATTSGGVRSSTSEGRSWCDR